MPAAINFLNARSKYRVTTAIGKARSRLVFYGVILGVAFSILGIVYIAGNYEIGTLVGKEQLLRVTQTKLDADRTKDNAALDTEVGDVDPLLPRIDTIRQSGPRLADDMANKGNTVPAGSWVNTIADAPDTGVSIQGGVRNLSLLALLMKNLSGSGLDPHLSNSEPQQGGKVYLSYDVSAHPPTPSPSPPPAGALPSITAAPVNTPSVTPSPRSPGPTPSGTPLTQGAQQQ